MELNAENVSAMSAAETQNAIDMKVAKLSLDAAKAAGAQMILLIDAAAPAQVQTAAPAAPSGPAPNATTGVMLDTYA